MIIGTDIEGIKTLIQTMHSYIKSTHVYSYMQYTHIHDPQNCSMFVQEHKENRDERKG